METQTVTAHVPRSLVSQVDAIAARMDRPRGWVIKEALADWVATQDEQRQMIADGLADMAAGRAIDHSVMQAWANSASTDKPLPAAEL